MTLCPHIQERVPTTACRTTTTNCRPAPSTGLAAENQETKLTDDKFPHAAFTAAGYRSGWFGQKTYNGGALLTRADAAAELSVTDVVKNIPGHGARLPPIQSSHCWATTTSRPKTAMCMTPSRGSARFSARRKSARTLKAC